MMLPIISRFGSGALSLTLVLALTLAILSTSVGVDSKSVNDDHGTRAIRSHISHEERILTKREATTTTHAPTKSTRRHHRTSAHPNGKLSSTTKKHHGSGGGSSSGTHKPHKSTTGTPSTTKSPSTSKGPSTSPKSTGGTSTRAKTSEQKLGTSTTTLSPVSYKRTTAKPLTKYQKWLMHEERVAIEHMFAGVFDWMKVLKQTDGTVFNRQPAGEIFHLIDDKLKPLFAADNKPDDLKAEFIKGTEGDSKEAKRGGERRRDGKKDGKRRKKEDKKRD